MFYPFGSWLSVCQLSIFYMFQRCAFVLIIKLGLYVHYFHEKYGSKCILNDCESFCRQELMFLLLSLNGTWVKFSLFLLFVLFSFLAFAFQRLEWLCLHVSKLRNNMEN